MPEPYQAEFDQLTQTAETPEPAVETIEIPVGEQKYKLPLTAEVPLKENGQIQNIPLSRLLNGFRQSAQLERKLLEYKQKMESLGDLDQWKQRNEKYGAIQDWSEKNPEQWARLHQLWQEREKALAGKAEDPLYQSVAEMRKQLQDLAQFRESFQKEQEEAKIQSEMKKINEEIQTFQKDFPEINLEETDADGVPLKAKVVNFGIEHRLPTFEAAALVYLKPKLLETAQFRGRTEAVKSVKEDAAKGIVNRSRTPVPGQSLDPKRMSWEQLKDAARDEFEQLSKT